MRDGRDPQIVGDQIELRRTRLIGRDDRWREVQRDRAGSGADRGLQDLCRAIPTGG